MLNTNKTCKVEGCKKKHRGLGYCLFHYKQYYRKINRKKLSIENKDYRNHHKKRIAYTKKIWYIKNRERLLKKLRDNPEISLKMYQKICKHFNVNARSIKYALTCWSKTIRKRDNYTCQVCGKYDKQNIAHHILYKSKYPLLVLNVRNGITLCKKCHYEVHGGVFFA